MPSQSRYFARFGIRSPTYAVHRITGKAIRDRAERYLHGRLVEIGCGDKAKHDLIGDLVEEHVGLDIAQSPHGLEHVDIVGTAYDIPAEDESFDCVLSTAVLEHLEEPEQAIQEAFRVLKPGGHALYTMPLYWHLHEEPRDFYRYTRHGVKYLFETAGFQIVEVTPFSGFLTTFATQWSYYLQRFRKGPLTIPVDLVTVVNNLVFPVLDRGPLRDERFTWNYLLVARKPLV